MALVWTQALAAQALVIAACGLSSCGPGAQPLLGIWNPPGSGVEPGLLHWQADSSPVHYQGSPRSLFVKREDSWHKLEIWLSQRLYIGPSCLGFHGLRA